MTDAARSDEDEIEASRAPLLDHLSELRTRLLIALAAVVVATGVCYLFAKDIYIFLVEPYHTAVLRTQGAEAAQNVRLQATHPFEIFFTNLKVALFAGIVVAFPVVAYQAYAFVAPGLYKRERVAAAPFLIAAPVMFLVGGAFVYYVAMPFAMQFALGLQVTEGPVQIELHTKVNEYFSLVTTLMLAFGLCFQLPVVLSLLASVGMVTAGILRKGRRYAVVGIAAIAACVTPPDVISMTMMFLPMYALYEASIWIVWVIERARGRRIAAEDAKLAAAE
ncbi:MAG: twin-arginine translocase subunit TatC [Alphaproteobacteria bacterium]|nr:twin-arginine translocase subunit TatC [Alphaproteobacteria bacterium]